MSFGSAPFGTRYFGATQALAAPPAPAKLSVKVADTEVLENLDWGYVPGSLSISESLAARSVADLEFFDETGGLILDVGKKVEITARGTLVFAGTIDEIEEEYPVYNPNVAARRVRVSCVDYNQVADRRLVQAVYEIEGLVTGATNASPIVVTTDVNHLLVTGDRIDVSEVGGNTAANGQWTVTVLTGTTFSLDGSTGNGTYTSGGRLRFMSSTIVRDLVQDHLSEDGISAGTIDDGQAMEKVVFDFDPVSEALDQLARVAGYHWYVDYRKKLHFLARATFTAPWGITASKPMHATLTRRRTREEYRNQQIVKAGRKISSSTRQRVFKGDGETKVFPLEFPVAKKPKVETNVGGAGYVARTVGNRQVDDDSLAVAAGGKQWFWEPRSNEISQNRDSSEVALGAADLLRVTYFALIPIVVVETDSAAVTDRKTMEGGSGLYQAIEIEPRIESFEFAEDYAKSFLTRLGRIHLAAEIQTDSTGLRAGQLQPINLPAAGLSGNYLISEVRYSDRGDLDLRLNYRALDGQAVLHWVEFWRRLAQQGQKFGVRETEILLGVFEQADSVQLSDALTSPSTNELSSWTVDTYTVLRIGSGVIGKSIHRFPTLLFPYVKVRALVLAPGATVP